MAEITTRRTGELLRKLFEILLKEPEGLQAKTALERLAESVTLSAYEAGLYEGGERRFEKVVRFATVDCTKAGWLAKSKGTWSITADGEEAYQAFPDPEAFYREASRLYRKWAASREPVVSVPISGEDSIEEEAEVEKTARITFEKAEEQSWTEIEQYLREMNPYDFQDLVAELLRAMGYHVSWVSPPGKDSGVDILAHTDPLGTRSPRIKVQVKRVGQRVSADIFRAFVELIGDEDVGLYVSTGGFTKDAEDYARGHRSKRITLIDLERLVDLWIESYEKLEDRARQRLPLTPIYFLSPKT